MRFIKFDTSNSKAYTCCLCCHVRTGTIFLGIFALLMELISLAVFAVTLIHPEVLQLSDQIVIVPDPELNDSFSWIAKQQTTNDDRFFALLFMGGMISITVMLIYGAIKGRPGYLMPYFCIQVFNFCITCLSGIGYFSYMPNIKRWIEAQVNLPFQEELLEMDTDWLMLLFVLSFAIVLLIQAYIIGVIWACYKYLIEYEKNVASGNLPVRNYPTEGSDDVEDVQEMLLPPKYEDAVRQSAEEPPPPPYSNDEEE